MSTQGSPLVVTRVGGRHRGRITVAAWLAVLIAVVTWVVAAGIGSTPRDGRSATVPGAGATQPPLASSTPSRLPSSRPSPSGPMELLQGPAPSGSVWLRSGNGVRSLDLSTGKAGRVVDTVSWRERVLQLPDGRFLCVCLDVAPITGGERVKVVLAELVGRKRISETSLRTVEGQTDTSVPTQEQGLPVNMSASLSPDGGLVVVGLAVRRPPSWERSLLVIHVASREVLQRIELDPIAADDRVDAWAPRIQFASDGLRVLVSLTTLLMNSATDERHFVAWVHGMLLPLEPVAGFGTKEPDTDGRCVDTWPGLVGHDTMFGICRGASGNEAVLRSVAIDSGEGLDLDLQPILQGSFPMQLVDQSTGTLFLWDPFAHHAARIHVATAKLESSTVVEMPTAALPPLEHLARSFSAWIAPIAAAKIMLEPGLALSPDGRVLYVVAMSGNAIAEPGSASTIIVLDAVTLRVQARWTVEPDVVSIAIAPEGRDVVVGTLEAAPEGVNPEAGVMLLDGETGAPRARYQGLGTEWPMLVDPSRMIQ